MAGGRGGDGQRQAGVADADHGDLDGAYGSAEGGAEAGRGGGRLGGWCGGDQIHLCSSQAWGRWKCHDGGGGPSPVCAPGADRGRGSGA